ncbi:MAG: sulfatase [Lentisphaerae bacterium]|mgnify:CR=1 FL=1|jgi:arylsulfatase A-like enzyme|nr:sulfatase [Lentisphaerota bacterium]MBT4821859.1 sulfatase [Lentisphaerota bacterium]MBT5605500.1 sulfatase [Lentisphaerota bacterium]MBT7060069.1 sulfatase [Lentisphaerota bacterium]MBT7840871.1 sulfatase [Lentisphaerota bacterium]
MAIGRCDFLKQIGLALLVGLALPGLLRSAPLPKRPPNIVFLYADDLGWTDLGCYGSGYYETPNLDRLCAQSMRFTDAYSPAANCAPARACVFSGQYAPRHGVYTVGGKRRFDTNKRLLKWHERKLLAPDNEKGLAGDKVTFAEALKAAGYVCGHFGKWHLGGGAGESPAGQGFAESLPIPTSKTHWIRPDGGRRKSEDEPKAYLSDVLAGRALSFLEANRDRPFCLYYAEYLVHVPLEAKEALVAKYKAKAAVGGHRNPVYAAMIETLDTNFGRVLSKLDELGLAENTMVIFFSDNGGCGTAKNPGLGPGNGLTSNVPLRGMKGMLYEGGIRVPMFVRWPGITSAGSVCRVPVTGVDLYPTFVEVAGAQAPSEQELDGESIVPLLRDSRGTLERTDIFWWMPGYLPGRQAPAHAMRSGDYKVIEFFEDGKLELYNLREDIGERNDLSGDRPELLSELRAKLIAWRKATGATIPARNPQYDQANDGRW